LKKVKKTLGSLLATKKNQGELIRKLSKRLVREFKKVTILPITLINLENLIGNLIKGN